VDPWLDGTLRFGGGYSTWSPPSNAQMGQARPGAPHACTPLLPVLRRLRWHE